MFGRTERRGFPGGLRAQFLFGLLLLVIGTMALVALIGLQLAKRQIRQSEAERTVSAARQLGALGHLAQGSQPEPGRVVDMFRTSADIAYARLSVDDQSHRVGDRSLAAEAKSLDFGDAESGADFRIVERDGEPFVVASAVGRTDQFRWRADVARSLDDAYLRIQQSRRLLLAYLGIDALFILIVGYAFLTYVVVRPIRAIGVATERAARGDLASPIEVLPPNEFGRVGRSFNDMLDELRDKRHALRERLEELDAAYRELEQTQESLIRSEKLASVGQLAAGVAHEIGNPLSAISGYLDLLEDDDLDPEQKHDMLERMRNQVARIRTIIRDLLDYSRDDVDEPVGPTKLAPCIAEAIELLEPQPRARGIDFETDVPDDLPKVRGNKAQIVQVLVNLLINAADAMEREELDGAGSVRLAARLADGADSAETFVELRVTDDGPGIPEEEVSRVFDPFYTTKDPGEGTGLGLAIAQRIMDRFGGELSVEATSPDGTTFLLTFPKAGTSL